MYIKLIKIIKRNKKSSFYYIQTKNQIYDYIIYNKIIIKKYFTIIII